MIDIIDTIAIHSKRIFQSEFSIFSTKMIRKERSYNPIFRNSTMRHSFTMKNNKQTSQIEIALSTLNPISTRRRSSLLLDDEVNSSFSQLENEDLISTTGSKEELVHKLTPSGQLEFRSLEAASPKDFNFLKHASITHLRAANLKTNL